VPGSVHDGAPLLEEEDEALVLEEVVELLVVASPCEVTTVFAHAAAASAKGAIAAQVAILMVILPLPTACFMMRCSEARSMGRVAR
jgi:hypothetical protein